MKRFHHILYTDDDMDDGELFELALREIPGEKEFHFFDSARTLFNFLHACDGLEDTLLFIDLNMPVKDGLQCLAELRSNKLYRKLPVIVYSTSQHAEDILKCYDAGANLYARKPNTFKGISQVLKKVLELNWDNYFPKPPFPDFYLK